MSKSSITNDRLWTMPTHRPPTHPGEMLNEECLKPIGISQTAFAEALGVSRLRLNEIISGKRRVTAETALRLSRVLGTSPEFWLNLQQMWDLYEAQHAPDVAAIARLKPLRWRGMEALREEIPGRRAPRSASRVRRTSR